MPTWHATVEAISLTATMPTAATTTVARTSATALVNRMAECRGQKLIRKKGAILVGVPGKGKRRNEGRAEMKAGPRRRGRKGRVWSKTIFAYTT